ncbi:MAG: phosphonate transport system substrate-binding protein, partial [Candidatus Paceibacteria bacterium]
MLQFFRENALLIAIALTLTVSSCEVKGADDTLRFSAIPGENTSLMIEKFGALATHLSAELGVPVQYVHVSDYGASVEAFKNGDVSLAWFGGLTGVRARRAVSGAEAIAQGKVDPAYKSYFIANKNSGLTPSDEFPMQLQGKSFTFGSDSSTSGRLMPEFFMREATGKSPKEFLGSEMNFSGNHDRTLQLVQDGTFDAGVLSYKTYDTRLAEGKVDEEKVFILWTTPAYPDYSWNAHPNLEERFGSGFTEKLQKALVAIEDPALLDAM